MINHHLAASEREELIAQRTNALGLVEIGANNQIRLLQQRVRLRTTRLVNNILIGLGQPRQEIRKSIRHNHRHMFALRLQEMAHRQRRTHSIAIGRHMRENNYVIRLIDKLLGGTKFRSRKNRSKCCHCLSNKNPLQKYYFFCIYQNFFVSLHAISHKINSYAPAREI